MSDFRQHSLGVFRRPPGSAISPVSVVMATFNGFECLGQQLASLSRQTRLPTELVVYDDGSTDGTLALLDAYAAKAPFDVKIVRGGQRKGANAAYRNALQACRGDVVFLCDQDGIWFPHKIEASLAALKNTPRAGFVFCDAIQCAPTGQHLSQTHWQTARFTSRQQRRYRRHPLETIIAGGNFVHGASSAYRRALIEPFVGVEYAGSSMTYNTWLALCTTATGHPGFVLRQKLLAYRQHPRPAKVEAEKVAQDPLTQALWGRIKFSEQIRAYQMVRLCVNRFARAANVNLDHSLAILDRMIAFLEARAALRRDRNLGRALRAIFDPDYWELGQGLVSVLKDYRGIW